MKSIDEFFSERNPRACREPVSMARKLASPLHVEVRQAAERSFAVFPVPESARLAGRPDHLIAEATSEMSLVEELAAKYPSCGWRIALGPTRLCALVVDGPHGRASLTALSRDEDDSHTLQALGGDTTWAFFQRPHGLRIRQNVKDLARGVTFLADGDSCPIPPSGGSAWKNPGAEIETVPVWLRTLVFESSDDPPGRMLPAVAHSHLPAPRHSLQHMQEPHRRAQNRRSTGNHPGWSRGFRMYSRR